MTGEGKKKRALNMFRFRLFFIFAAILMAPSMFASYLLYQNSQEESKRYTGDEIQYNLSQNAAAVESKLNAVSDAETTLKFAIQQNSAVMTPNEEQTDVEIFSEVQKTFSTYTSLIDETYNVSGFSHFYLYYPYRTLLLVSDATFFTDVLANTLNNFIIEEGKWGIATPYENVICNPTLGEYFYDQDFTKYYKVKDEKDNELYLCACIDERYVYRLLSANFQIQPSYLAILDPYGKALSVKEQNGLGKVQAPYLDMINRMDSMDNDESFEIQMDGEEYILNWVYSAENDWYYVCATNTKDILSEVDFYRKIILGVGIFVLLSAAALAWGVDLWMQNQAGRLIESMHDIEKQVTLEQVPNQLEKTSVFPESVGYERVYDEFYGMVSRVCGVAKEALKQKDKQTMTTIQMLQTELDPHMLYNSLESAYSIAKINKQEEIADLIMALSKFFRIALSGGRHFVAFREAFELAKQYVNVQNVRVNNKITFTYSIDERVQDLIVPKFLLQPLVENAVIHGFKNKRDEWKIHIEAKTKETDVIITVTDNGIGMNELALAKLNEKIHDGKVENLTGNKGYALRNLNYQLGLKYGGESGVELQSVYGEGVVAKIRLCGVDSDTEARRRISV